MIRIRNLWKKFDPLQVMAGLDLDVQTGETLVVLGPSGIGKSVLLKHIIGILKPDLGSIEVDGKNLSSLKGDELYQTIRNMGMLFQGGALFDSMNVEQNTAFYLAQHGHPKTSKPYSKQEIKDLVTDQ